MCRCLAPEVWVQPLAGRFLRLVLQLLARFGSWLSSGLAARSGALPSPPAAEGDDSSASDRWAVGMKADQLCSLRADTERLMDWLSNEYTGQLLQLLPFATEEVGMDLYTIVVPWQSTIINSLGLPGHAYGRATHAVTS